MPPLVLALFCSTKHYNKRYYKTQPLMGATRLASGKNAAII